ncbi:DUF6894 family protein [Tardiphaga sp. 172_B4_N1_3]|uniref:DUF6894 family protein n=1 Tax=Tardiphaga sp. 172_B4_N1_3 TaxID=3240787 RepID=UPI003F8A402E
MTLYEFDIEDGVVVNGASCECASMAEAHALALRLAFQLAREEPEMIGRGCAISVKSEDGLERRRVEIDDINRRYLAH